MERQYVSHGVVRAVRNQTSASAPAVAAARSAAHEQRLANAGLTSGISTSILERVAARAARRADDERRGRTGAKAEERLLRSRLDDLCFTLKVSTDIDCMHVFCHHHLPVIFALIPFFRLVNGDYPHLT